MRKRKKKFITEPISEVVLQDQCDDTDLNDLNEMAIEEEKDSMNATDDLSFGQIFLDDMVEEVSQNTLEEPKDVIVSVFPKIDKFGSVMPRS